MSEKIYRDPSLIPQMPEGQVIPRILHQVFFGGAEGNEMPPSLKENVDRLIAANPGWEYRLYDDRDMASFIAKEYGEDVLARLRSINPLYAAARVDLFRYLLMYRVGGIYLDIKSTADQPLNCIAQRAAPFALSHWDDGPGGRHGGWGIYPELASVGGREFQQWHVIAAPGHPYLRAVINGVLKNIDEYRPWRSGFGRKGVFRLTGPIAYSLAIFPILERHPHRAFSDERDIGLIYNVMGDGNHRGLFRTHYAFNAAPLVIRAGARYWADAIYTAPIRVFYGFLTLKARLGVMVRARPALARGLKQARIIR